MKNSTIISNENLSSDDDFSVDTDHYIKDWVIPFYHVKLGDWERKKNALLKIWEHNSKDNMISGDLHDQSTDYGNYNNYHSLIENVLYEDITDGLHALNLGETITVDTAWFQIYDNSRYHPPHNHGLGHLSLVVFIEFDEDHLPTTFIAPFISLRDGNVMEYIPKGVTEGSMVLFPSGIMHYAPVNQIESKRMILAANLTIDEGSRC
jgi:stress-induced morphogen